MKIALLTFANNLNYGGSLQAYALEKAIAERYSDIECEYILYSKNQWVSTKNWLIRKIVSKILRKDDNPSWTLFEFARNSFKIIMDTQSKYGKRNIELFKQFWALSKYTSPVSRKDLKVVSDNYDIYVVGSDQVWNCGRLDLDTTYLLDFVDNDNKKNSYASSLALKSIPQKYSEIYKELLSKFKNISCREKHGSVVISNLIGKYVETVVDPVFLISENDWIKLMVKPKYLEKDKKYLLVYMLDYSKKLVDYSKEVSKKKNLEVVYLYSDINKNNNIGPAEWLWYVKNAAYIITNSFHGTAFSIIFKVPFNVEITDNVFFESASDRITDLLGMLNLEDRIIDGEMVETGDIDFGKVLERLNDEIEKSFKYLDTIISS